jgi:hypothetical protein
MPAMPKRPWAIYLTFLAILVVVVAWCIYWLAGARFVRDRFETELAHLQGVALTCKAMDWGGFPFRFEHDCIDPKLTVQGDEADAKRLLLVIQAYMPNRAVALLDGPVVLRRGLTVTHERAMASARFWGEHDWQASIELPKVKASPFGSADYLLLSARDTGTDKLDIAATARVAEALLGPGTLLKVDEAELVGTVPRAAVDRDFLSRLGQSGKPVGIDTLRLKKGDLVMTAKGEVGVTAQGLVNGHLVTTTSRLDLLMNELKQTFGLSDKDAQTFATMIGLLQPGKTTDIKLDLIAKDGKLYWGPVKLTDIPPVF